jgi:hypothetical protein
MQMPLKQTGRDEVHVVPHVPQLNGSRPRFAQLLPHRVSPAAQLEAQAPAVQTCLAAHAIPHEPQWAGSFCV